MCGELSQDQPGGLCRCSSSSSVECVRAGRGGSRSKEGAGQRGRKRKRGRAAMLCRDKVTPLQDGSVHEERELLRALACLATQEGQVKENKPTLDYALPLIFQSFGF